MMLVLPNISLLLYIMGQGQSLEGQIMYNLMWLERTLCGW